MKPTKANLGKSTTALYLMFVAFLCGIGIVNIANAESNQLSNSSVIKKSSSNRLVYIVSDTNIPFWSIMSRGIKNRTKSLGYELSVYSTNNSAKKELQSLAKAINDKVAGIIISPTTSSACVTLLKLAKRAGIPVVISDIGTDSGDYVSFISSDNKAGAYNIGKVLTNKLNALGWSDASVGIVAIPQKRVNGQLRTSGFIKALDEAGIKGAGLKQQVTFSEDETYKLSLDLIKNNPKLRALWLQGSDKYKGALKAIKDSGKKDNILLLTFDAEPEFIKLIPSGVLVGSAMQQPYLMGQEAVNSMHKFLTGKEVVKNIQLPILAISTENIASKLSIINKNVLGIEE